MRTEKQTAFPAVQTPLRYRGRNPDTEKAASPTCHVILALASAMAIAAPCGRRQEDSAFQRLLPLKTGFSSEYNKPEYLYLSLLQRCIAAAFLRAQKHASTQRFPASSTQMPRFEEPSPYCSADMTQLLRFAKRYPTTSFRHASPTQT